MIDEKYIEQVLDRADIVDVIGGYVKLKGAVPTTRLVALYTKRKPLFLKLTRTGIWHCFGCHKGGNVISFIMEHETMNYRSYLFSG